jgi:hypothetical protein
MCTLAPGDPALGGARCFVVTCRSKMSPPSVDAGEAGVLRNLELGDALPGNCYVVRRESRDPGLSLPADRRGSKGVAGPDRPSGPGRAVTGNGPDWGPAREVSRNSVFLVGRTTSVRLLPVVGLIQLRRNVRETASRGPWWPWRPIVLLLQVIGRILVWPAKNPETLWSHAVEPSRGRRVGM